jgi:drug/metabolite transporter (DMT)-like permease
VGIGTMVAASACFATMDTTTRYLGAAMAVQLMLWSRYTLHTLVMAAWIALDARVRFATRHPRFQVLRGLLLLGSSTLAFFGLQHLPVAEFTAIVLLTPVLVTVLARWLLHEAVSPLRWALVAGGFVGALIVIRPGSGLFGWAVLLPLGAAVTNATFQVVTTRLNTHGGDAGADSALTTNFYTGLVGTAVLTPVLLASPIDVPATLGAAPATHLALLLAIGALGTLGHLLLILSLGRAPTAVLMPFLYTQIGFAALVGWLVFRHVPDFWAWVGMLVIAACGAASALLNLGGRAPTPVADTMPG